MRILVVGNGAREDALSWQLGQSPSCTALYAAPGNAGTASRGKNWAIAATDGKGLVAAAQGAKIDLVVLGPETAIAAGVGDRMREAGFLVFGPDRAAGRLESSKVFSKRFMQAHGIPTARAVIVHSLENARKVLASWEGGCVVKADGLAAGKGVVVAADAAEARDVVSSWYGTSGIPGGGNDVLLEECLVGREVSVFAIGDGRRFVPFAAACDYKRAFDGDLGPNTGGMGAYSPPGGFPNDMMEQVSRAILDPVSAGLSAENMTYNGVLYCGIMWTKDGPRVIEFNVRFGDPETQVLMPRVTGDFARLLRSAAEGNLDRNAAQVDDRACVGVVLASSDYPATSAAIAGLPPIDAGSGAAAFWGGSTAAGDLVNASGGRVLTIAATGPNLEDARRNAYAAVERTIAGIGRTGALRYRRDIAADAVRV